MSSLNNELKTERPLSPHLQVFRWPMGMLMSILHRATGIALSVGALVLAWFLVALVSGEAAYAQFMDLARSPFGVFCLLGWTYSLFYHMGNGIRHLVWDMGYLFKLRNAFRAGWVIWVFAAVMTAATWLCG